MRTLTNKHIADINVLMLTLVAEYTEQLHSNANNADIVKMQANDIAFNTRALVEFNAEHNAQELLRSIMLQDTAVREHFEEVINYLWANVLASFDDLYA